MNNKNQDQFLQRYWEMVLCDYLINNNFIIEKTCDGGIDFSFNHENKQFYIEAICPLIPNNSPIADFYESFGVVKCDFIDSFKERLTGAIREKAKKINAKINGQVIEDNAYNIIAISSAALGHYGHASGYSIHPMIVELAYGIGYRTLEIGKDTGKTYREYNAYTQTFKKHNQNDISHNFFREQREYSTFDYTDYKKISGILYCHAQPFGFLTPEKFRFSFLHNEYATNKIPINTFPCDDEYYYEDDLKMIEHNNDRKS